MIYTELKHMPERSKTYLGSPSIIRLEDGTLVASHDYFFKEIDGFDDGLPRLTSVYRSEDDGATWVNCSQLIGAFWSTLFLHKGDLYMIGCDRRYGSIVIRRSLNGGYSWSFPLDAKRGLLFEGGAAVEPPNYHCAPTPVLVHEGRIYRAYEDNVTALWPSGFEAFVISADLDSDLLDAKSWTMSNKLPFDPSKVPSDWGETGPGFLEGNMVAGPDGQVWNILRMSTEPYSDYAAMLRVDDGGEVVSFDYENDIIRLPGGTHKFTIRRDPETGLYFTLGNHNTVPGSASQRNVVSLSVSKDLRNWEIVKTVIEDESGLSEEDSIRLTGFQYVDWQFDGDDIIALVRTAWRGSVRFHDSNRITYHVVKRFRQLCQQSGALNKLDKIKSEAKEVVLS